MKTAIFLLRTGALLTVLLVVLLGGIYPILTLGIAQIVFPQQANGSLVKVDSDKHVGSALLGQEFSKPRYFWGRLSATTPSYNAASSGGSNYSPANPALLAAAEARVALLLKHGGKKPIPVDLVTASGSGLDPHISVSAAEYQVERVAKARGMKESHVRGLVHEHSESSVFLQDKYVNVLLLNMVLDKHQAVGVP
jgi:K+-transporting ATPase ATPase C chain